MIQVSSNLQERAINTIRFLAADAVQAANSGHPGLPMGAAAVAYTLWMRHMRYNPRNPHWPGRDRFLLSGGHGSMLLYSMLHLTGYDLSIEDIKQFRQFDSRTPGHPESFLTPGVEVTTGPLGQGFANGVGMAAAAEHVRAVFNRPGHELIDSYIYAIVTDGDLMEGVASEAASLAGHLQLGRLIYIYDDNRISIDGSTDLAFTEDRARRFEAYNWQVLRVQDGNDVEALDHAVSEAKADPRPSLIICRTTIGYGLPKRAGTAEAHGEPPGDEELNGAKQALGWPLEPRFLVPDDVSAHFRQAQPLGQELEQAWEQKMAAYRSAFPDLAAELDRRLRGLRPEGWDQDLPLFPADPKGMATRVSSGKVINTLAKRLPELIGGSADLTPSTKTNIDGSPDFQNGSYEGRNFHFGVREHAMGSAVNGMAHYGAVIPFGATFLVFSDYMRPAIRLSALSRTGSIWVFTHDSVGLGEDGPTHQPVEHYAALRSIPRLHVIRPADANEVTQAWKAAVDYRKGPTALLLTRQNVPTLDRTRYASAAGLHKGAYVLADLGDAAPAIILMASGSEVSLIVAAGEQLAQEGIGVRLVSFPSWELFAAQDPSYCDSVLSPSIHKRLAVEAGVSQGWDRWTGPMGDMISIDTFGNSAPGKVVLERYGFTVENVLSHARKLLAV